MTTVQARICFHQRSPEYFYLIKGNIERNSTYLSYEGESRIFTDRGVQSTGRRLDWVGHSVLEDKWSELSTDGGWPDCLGKKMTLTPCRVIEGLSFS